jgi:hypothetical protein
VIEDYPFIPSRFRLACLKYEKPASAGYIVVPWYIEIRVKSSPGRDEFEEGCWW